MNRRYFLLGTGPTALLRPTIASASPNGTVRVACVGVRKFGAVHMRQFARIPGVEVAALCDVDQSILEARLKELEERGAKRPATYIDYRKLLEDKSIDAVAIAVPNHWHALMTVWACQAGKDVYVEKPCSHNIFEAQQMVAAARKYNRVVQHGTHTRSSAAIREARAKLSEGLIGDVYMARGLCFNWRDTIGHASEEPVPAGVNYDLWVGPAPMRPFTRNRFHYNWNWQWAYGNGDIGNQGIHQMDICRWFLGVRYPKKVSALGGHFMFDDDQETPNTLTATFEFDHGGNKKLLVFEVRHWMTNGESWIRNTQSGDTIGTVFYGSNGYLACTEDGYRSYLGKKQEPGPARPDPGHDYRLLVFSNFIDAVRSRDRSQLHSEIEEGAASTVLVHLANISYRLGRTLHFDSSTMTCRGDEEANRMFTRDYRAPFVVPTKV